MNKVYLLLCCTVFIASAYDTAYDEYGGWYDEVDFDKLFAESNEDVPKEDVVSSEEYRNFDNIVGEPISLDTQVGEDIELKEHREFPSNVLDKYSDDYQIEDNRSEVKDDVSVEKKEEDTPNQDNFMEKLDDILKEESQEVADDLGAKEDDAPVDKKEEDTPNQDSLVKELDDILKESDELESHEVASDFDAKEDDVSVDRKDVDIPNLQDFMKEYHDLLKEASESENQEAVYDIDAKDDDLFVNKREDDTSNQNDFINEIDFDTFQKLVGGQNMLDEALLKTILSEQDDDTFNLSDLFSNENLLQKDAVEPLFLSPLVDNIKEINQNQDDEKEDNNDSNVFDIIEENKNLEGPSNELDEVNQNNNGHASIENELAKDNLKVDDILDDNLDKNSVDQVYQDLNNDLDKLLEIMDKLKQDDLPKEENLDDYIDGDVGSVDNIDGFVVLHANDQFEYDDDFVEDDVVNDNSKNAEIDDADYNSKNEFDESNPNYHPADSKKDDDQLNADFNSSDLVNEFEESNPDFHPADSKKDDESFDTVIALHPADSEQDDIQFDTNFNSNLESEFEESNPNFHPADSKKDDDQFDTGFDSANSDDNFDDTNPDFHPADSEKDIDEFDTELDAKHNSIELEKTLQEADNNQDESDDIIMTEDKEEEDTSEKKLTKDVKDLTGPELDQLTRQFAMLHKEELSLNSENIERNADHVELNAYEPVVITSPAYPEDYPTTADLYPMDWILEGQGHGIELNVTDLSINSGSGHYLLIKPGGVDATGSDGIVFAFRLDEPRKYRFRNVDRLFVRFNGESGMPFFRGFSMSVKMIEPLYSAEEELPEPEPVVPAPQAVMTLLLSGLNTTEFEGIRDEFRRLLADMATMYIHANDIDPGHNSTYFTTQITRTYVCQLNWPGFDSCVEVQFAIPLVYEDDQDHRLNETDLLTMWYQYIGQDPFRTRLERMGITDYSAPNDSSILMVWLVIAIGVLISMVMLACTLWRFSCLGSYTRMPAYSDTDSIQNEKRGLDMYPTPHQTLPPLYAENEYKWLDANFDDTKVDMGGFTNSTYVRGDLTDESDEDVIASRTATDV